MFLRPVQRRTLVDFAAESLVPVCAVCLPQSSTLRSLYTAAEQLPPDEAVLKLVDAHLKPAHRVITGRKDSGFVDRETAAAHRAAHARRQQQTNQLETKARPARTHPHTSFLSRSARQLTGGKTWASVRSSAEQNSDKPSSGCHVEKRHRAKEKTARGVPEAATIRKIALVPTGIPATGQSTFLYRQASRLRALALEPAEWCSTARTRLRTGVFATEPPAERICSQKEPTSAAHPLSLNHTCRRFFGKYLPCGSSMSWMPADWLLTPYGL